MSPDASVATFRLIRPRLWWVPRPGRCLICNRVRLRCWVVARLVGMGAKSSARICWGCVGCGGGSREALANLRTAHASVGAVEMVL